MDSTPLSNKTRSMLEDSNDFIERLNAAANARAETFDLLGRYLLERPALHATLAELLREYPPQKTNDLP